MAFGWLCACTWMAARRWSYMFAAQECKEFNKSGHRWLRQAVSIHKCPDAQCHEAAAYGNCKWQCSFHIQLPATYSPCTDIAAVQGYGSNAFHGSSTSATVSVSSLITLSSSYRKIGCSIVRLTHAEAYACRTNDTQECMELTWVQGPARVLRPVHDHKQP